MFESLKNFAIIPVLVLDDVESGLKMCELLCENGLPITEITFRTAAAAEAIRQAGQRFPDLCLGVGTILNPSDLKRVIEAEAELKVAPGLNSAVVKAAQSVGFDFASGVCTPSEIEQGLELGCRFF